MKKTAAHHRPLLCTRRIGHRCPCYFCWKSTTMVSAIIVLVNMQYWTWNQSFVEEAQAGYAGPCGYAIARRPLVYHA
jgi:hypothetical protein